MNEREFHELLDELDELSGNDLEDRLAEIDEPHIISLLAGSEYDDIGLGRTSVCSVATDVWDDFEDS